jgi:hypothetical protein
LTSKQTEDIILIGGSKATVPAAARRPLRLVQDVVDPRRNRAAAGGKGVFSLKSRGAIFFIALVLLASACASVQGAVDLVFGLSPAVQYGYPLDTLRFDGALTNLGGGVTITSVSFTVPPELLVDSSPYTAGWCEYVPYMWTKSGPLFDVTIAAGTAPGTYDGTVQLEVQESVPTGWLQGGPPVQGDPGETVEAKFEVIVRGGAAVPESSALALGVLGASKVRCARASA